LAVTTGNTYVLKPSERVPLSTMFLADLATEAGLPPGVLNVVHGAHDCVNFLCDAPEIRAVSFVGGDAAGRRQGGKRVLQFRFNMSVPRARALEKASTRRERSER
jgi:acyl-CoA reductase-like NAD-dependent aldehyde dehydrogenase